VGFGCYCYGANRVSGCRFARSNRVFGGEVTDEIKRDDPDRKTNQSVFTSQ